MSAALVATQRVLDGFAGPGEADLKALRENQRPEPESGSVGDVQSEDTPNPLRLLEEDEEGSGSNSRSHR